MSAIADSIRQATQRSQERWYRERQAEAFATRTPSILEEASRGEYLSAVQEMYNLGYTDADAKEPHRLDGLLRQVS